MTEKAVEEMTEDELLREREKILADAGSFYICREAQKESKSTGQPKSEYTPRHVALFEWYKSKYSQPVERDPIEAQWSWLEGVSKVVEEIETCYKVIESETKSVQAENSKMVNELAGLDEKSRKLLDEQSVLEKEVAEWELESNSVNVIRNINVLSNQKEILITNFPRFRSIVDSLDLVRADTRQYEHLKSKVCSVGVSVGLGAIEVYTKRMTQYIDDLEGSTVSSVSLFGKFTDTLEVVKSISTLFRGKDDREYFQSVSELEKALSDARQRICLPMIGDYINAILTSSKERKLPISLRKCVYFVNSIGKQEQALFESILGGGGIGSDSFLSLLRAIGLGLYYPLRTAVIATSDLSELRESAEILRLEIFTSSEYLGFIQSVSLKLQRDIQERLIYRVESFVRDEIRLTNQEEDSEFVRKTFDCLEILTGVVDPQTFREIANEAVTACVNTLMSSSQNSLKEKLFLISQLLALRERITLIDCESTLVGQDHHSVEGITDQLRRLMLSSRTGSPSPDVMIRARIESELRSLCESFNAGVVAKTISIETDGERIEFLSSIRADVRSALKTDGLDTVLTRPILAELEHMTPAVAEDVLAVLR